MIESTIVPAAENLEIVSAVPAELPSTITLASEPNAPAIRWSSLASHKNEPDVVLPSDGSDDN